MIASIEKKATQRRRPDGSPYASLAAEDAATLSRRFRQPLRRIEIEALNRGIVPERYVRNMTTFSAPDQARLLDASVVVVGQGGLGGTITELLARTGIGRMHLVDGDHFEASNLNRQLLSTMASMNHPKAAAAAERVAAINPAVEVRATAMRMEAANAGTIVSGADVAVDGLDSLESRFVLESACRRAGVPMVSAAVAGQTGQIMSIWPEDPGLALVYGPPDVKRPGGVERELGNLAPTVAVLAALECSEVCKIILGRPGVLRKRLLLVDLSDYTFETVALG